MHSYVRLKRELQRRLFFARRGRKRHSSSQEVTLCIMLRYVETLKWSGAI